MEEGTKQLVIGLFFACLIISLFCGAYAYNRKMKLDVFENTLDGLNDEQKCIYICAFQYPSGYLDQYKFCLEKCDRISERQSGCVE